MMILPSIHEGGKFKRAVRRLLSTLDGSYYEVQYCLCLYTNDESKDLFFALGNDNSAFSPAASRGEGFTEEDQKEAHKFMLGMCLIRSRFKYNGYFVVHSDYLREKMFEGKEGLLNLHVEHLLDRLGKFVVSTNEDLTVDEFILFKRSCVVRFKKIGEGYHGSEEGNSSNTKGGGYVGMEGVSVGDIHARNFIAQMKGEPVDVGSPN